MSALHFPGVVQSVRTLQDGTIKLDIHTPELVPDEMAHLFGLIRKSGWLLISPNRIEEKDIPDVDAPTEAGDKTPSQRLRAVLFVLWEQQRAKGDFDGFYRRAMEHMINQVKEKLEP